MANIFTTLNNATSTNNTRQLTGTAQLTQLTNSLAAQIVRQYTGDESTDEQHELVAESFKDVNSLEKLVDAVSENLTDDTSWLKELDDSSLDKMLKSQQSKRSRCKSKDMTIDNYQSMLSAAIAERAIRMALDKPKGASSTQRAGKRYTDEEIQMLANDQEALGKAIRNIQSKKSIIKSKAGFDPTAEAYQELLEDEEKLKAVRVGKTPDRTKSAVSELLVDVDIDKLKANEAKELLNSILGLTK